MSEKSEYQLGVDRAEACLRQVFVTGKSLLRHAQKLHEQLSMLSEAGLEVRYVPKPEAEDSMEARERLERMRSEIPSYLLPLHQFADGCAKVDEQLRDAVRDADAALIATAPLVDVATVSTEDRTTVRVRRQLRDLLRRTPSLRVAGWAQVAEPSVRHGMEEALTRIVAHIENLQLIATTPPCTESSPASVSDKRRRQVAGKPQLQRGPKLTKVDEAICLLNEPGRDWTVSELAQRVGCTKQTLHGSERFKNAWRGMKAVSVILHGSKHDGQVEATVEQDLTADLEFERNLRH